MRGCLRYWWSIVKDHDTEPMQLSNITFLLTWSVFFLSGQGDFSSTPTYHILQVYASEEAWAILALLIAVVWLYGFFAKWISLMLWPVFFASVFWFVLAASTLVSNPHSWAWMVNLILGLQAAWVYLRRGI